MRIPFVREYWIGRTFVHSMPAELSPPRMGEDVQLRTLTADDLHCIRGSTDPELRRRNAQPGPGVVRLGAWRQGTLAGVCTFVFGEAYDGYYALRADEAELIDIYTTPEHRGAGIASALIRHGTAAMHRDGFVKLYAKVWHNNAPSSNAFLRAGWTRECFFVRVQAVGLSRAIYVQWPPVGHATGATRATG